MPRSGVNTETTSVCAGLLEATDFAARKHARQRRKDAEATPFINHPITVTALLTRVAEVTDLCTLQAALLHDTVEDTETSPEELEQVFGTEVRELVLELTDDKSLPQSERKQRQVQHAHELSPKARLIKIADKIANLTDLSPAGPAGWSLQRKREYIDWAERVVAGIRGTNPALEGLFDETVSAKRRLLGV